MVAFLHVHVMALMVSTLIERTIRKAMKKEGIKSLPIYPEGRPCPTPTIFDIARLFQHTERYEVTIGDETTVFPAEREYRVCPARCEEFRNNDSDRN